MNLVTDYYWLFPDETEDIQFGVNLFYDLIGKVQEIFAAVLQLSGYILLLMFPFFTMVDVGHFQIESEGIKLKICYS